MKHIRSLLVRLAELPDRVDSLAENLRDLSRAIVAMTRPPPPPLAPFICALAVGQTSEGNYRSLGASARCKPHASLELSTNVALRRVALTVFADLELVSIHGVFCGVDLVTTALGDCPVAYFDEWPVGVKVRVQCLLRENVR